MARGGVEPPTFRFSVGRSYQLSYLALPDTNQIPRAEHTIPERFGVHGIGTGPARRWVLERLLKGLYAGLAWFWPCQAPIV